MVIILDCNSEIGAHVWSNFSYLESSHKSDFFLSLKRLIFLHAQHVPSYHPVQVPWVDQISVCQHIRVKVGGQLFSSRANLEYFRAKSVADPPPFPSL